MESFDLGLHCLKIMNLLILSIWSVNAQPRYKLMAWCKIILLISHLWRSYNNFAPSHRMLFNNQHMNTVYTNSAFTICFTSYSKVHILQTHPLDICKLRSGPCTIKGLIMKTKRHRVSWNFIQKCIIYAWISFCSHLISLS